MRAVAVFPSSKTIQVVDHPSPVIERDSEVLLDVLDVGICGTDREIARFDYGTPPEGSPYLVLGHESLARVAAIGARVSNVAVGDLVVTTVRRPCTQPWCRACRAGRQDFCFSGMFTERGINGRHGFMTEHVVDDAQYVHVVPETLRPVGVLVEPLTIAEKALIQVWDVQERLPWTAAGRAGDGHGQRAVVLGAGPVGLLGVLALLCRGFDVWVYSMDAPDSVKARWVDSVGAHYESSTKATLDELAQAVGNIDLIYEATGAAALSFDALRILGVNGVFVFTGVPGRKGPFQIEGSVVMRNMVLKNQLLFGTVNAGPDAFDAAIADLTTFYQRWREPLAALITARVSPDAAIELLTTPPAGIKAVVSFQANA